ncbi:unnamed protein product [Adineta ricciae]|nr:unnamed protein product [Adineta ricciae]
MGGVFGTAAHYLQRLLEKLAAESADNFENDGEVQEAMEHQNFSNCEKDTQNFYNLAVCDRSNTGKTTLVNCLRGLPDARKTIDFVYREDAPAPIGINETTTKPTRYR